METNRGKKGRKAVWHLTLGLKDTIFAGIGVVGLMMMSFALGALAGRGDIYRAAYSWGLLAADGARVAQWAPPEAAPVSTPTAPAAPVATAPPTPGPATAPVEAAARPPGAAPVTGSLAAAPASSSGAARKKAKSGSNSRDLKDREEELHRLRQEVAQKLKFQNSFDPAPKSAKQKSKEKETKAKSAAGPTQVRVALFRDAKSAKAKVAELQKKGIKASVKQGKDQKGAYYAVYRQSPPASPGSDKVAQKPDKNESANKPDSR